MALDWDNIEIIAEDENIVRLSEWSSVEIVTEDEEVIKTSDSDIINMDACDRMIIFSGQPGEPGQPGPPGPPGPPGYGAEWGNIGGTLSAQTDLQNALNAKANTADLGDLAYKDKVDWNTDIDNIPASFPPSTHNHDDRYYTETEVNSMLSWLGLVYYNNGLYVNPNQA